MVPRGKRKVGWGGGVCSGSEEHQHPGGRGERWGPLEGWKQNPSAKLPAAGAQQTSVLVGGLEGVDCAPEPCRGPRRGVPGGAQSIGRPEEPREGRRLPCQGPLPPSAAPQAPEAPEPHPASPLPPL